MDETELIALLQQFAESSDPEVELAGQLAGLTFAIHALLQFSCDPEARILAAAGLARLDPTKAEELLPVLIEGLQSADEAHRVYAAYACRNLGPAAASAVPKLTELLADDNEVVVQHVIQALEAIGHASASAVAGLARLLDGISPDSTGIHMVHALAAAAALGAIGPAAHEAIPALEQCLDLDGSEDGLFREVQLSAAEAIWQVSGDPQTALRVARKMLGDDESSIRYFAAELLGKLGPVARPAIADLQRLINDTEECVRQDAAEALAKIETPL